MPYLSAQMRESIAAGAVWGAYKGMEGFTRTSADKPLGNALEIIKNYNHLGIRGDMYAGAIKGADAFAHVAVGLYAYHLLAGHMSQLTHEQMMAHM